MKNYANRFDDRRRSKWRRTRAGALPRIQYELMTIECKIFLTLFIWTCPLGQVARRRRGQAPIYQGGVTLRLRPPHSMPPGKIA
jgi:hypothetical protein